jgi:hypothetical protein
LLPARVGAGLDVSFAGRTFDTALLTDLPASTDPCGVNGELEIDPPYTEGWTPRDGWITAPHQAEAVPRWLERAGIPGQRSLARASYGTATTSVSSADIWSPSRPSEPCSRLSHLGGSERRSI